MRNRGKLVQQRTREILSLENLVARHTGRQPKGNEIKQLRFEQLPKLLGSSEAALEASSHLMVMRTLDSQIQLVEQAVRARVKLRKPFLALETIPGVGQVLATTIMLETGDVGRFARVGQFASYCRCVASKRVSNGRKKGEGNAKNGNRYLAWAFVEAAHFALRYNERIRRFYQRKKAQRNGAVATKAVAHKLARAAYYVMRDEVAFDIDKAFA
jgi:transposase